MVQRMRERTLDAEIIGNGRILELRGEGIGKAQGRAFQRCVEGQALCSRSGVFYQSVDHAGVWLVGIDAITRAQYRGGGEVIGNAQARQERSRLVPLDEGDVRQKSTGLPLSQVEVLQRWR